MKKRDSSGSCATCAPEAAWEAALASASSAALASMLRHAFLPCCFPICAALLVRNHSRNRAERNGRSDPGRLRGRRRTAPPAARQQL